MKIGSERISVRLALPLAAILLGLSSASAHGGTYDVVACGGAAGGAQNAFAAVANPGMAAYNVCPNTPSNPASGIVTRASVAGGSGWVPYLSGAFQIFEAPPGASLASVSFDIAAIRLASYWTTGIVAYNADYSVVQYPYGCYTGAPGCGIGTPSFFGPITVGLNGLTGFRFETRCGNGGGCDISASGFQFGMRALFSAANVTVRVQDFTSPSVSPWGGSLFGGDWLRGSHSGFSTESDNVGIMANSTLVDGNLVYSEDFRNAGWPAWVRCDFTQRRPCHDIAGAGSYVNTRSLTDGAHELRIEAVDAAGNSGSTSRTIRVDNTAPARVNASVEGGEGWRQASDFTLGWRSPDEQVAPITTVHYSLCKNDGSCSSGSRSAEGADRLTGLSVPGPGEYTLRLWREDQAGNADRESASDPVNLRFDDVPPDAAFELIDENDPRRLDVRVSDAVSGVAGGAIEMRRAGYRQWHPIPTTLQSNRLFAYVDDLAVPDGSYEFRASVRDRAGNERLTALREDGSRMVLTLPLRTGTRIALSSVRTRHCRKARRGRKRRCTTRRRRPARGIVFGRLETADRGPIAGGAVAILVQPRTGGGFRHVTTLHSDARGRFAYKLGRGPSRTIRFHYEGAGRIKPATESMRVLVPARTTLRVNRASLRNGESVRFSGRLAGRPVPEGGKLIDLQAHYRGRWRTFATPRSDGRGRWSYRYRFGATRGLVSYRFRARIRREAAYPYELGYSRTIAVTVRGP